MRLTAGCSTSSSVAMLHRMPGPVTSTLLAGRAERHVLEELGQFIDTGWSGKARCRRYWRGRVVERFSTMKLPACMIALKLKLLWR